MLLLEQQKKSGSIMRRNTLSSMVSSVASALAPTALRTTGASGSGNSKDPCDIKSITTLSDCANSVKKAAEIKDEGLGIAAMQVIIRLLEEIEEAETFFVEGTSKKGITYNNKLVATNSTLSAAATQLGSNNAIISVDQLLGLKLGSVKNCENCLKVLCLLVANSNENRVKLSMTDTYFRVLRAMQLHVMVRSVVEWGLRVLRYLLMEDCAAARCMACGCCDIIVQTLSLNAGDSSIVELCCRVIYNLTHDDDEAGVAFGNNGACEILVVTVLQERFKSNTPVNVATMGLRAIGGLAMRNSPNKEMLSNLGACEIISKLVSESGILPTARPPPSPTPPRLPVDDNEDDFPSYPPPPPSPPSAAVLTSEEAELFGESVCWAIGNISYPNKDNQTRLGHLNCSSTIIELLAMYGLASAPFAREAFRAIRNLCHDHDSNRHVLLKQNACNIVVSTLRRHRGDADTVQWGWFAASSLADCDEGREALGAAGAVPDVADTIVRFGATGSVTQFVSMAIARLASSGEFRKMLGQVDDGNLQKALLQALTRHFDDGDVVEEVMAAVACLTEGDDNAVFLSDHGLIAVLMRVLNKHEKLDAVAVHCFRSIVNLLKSSDKTIISKLVFNEVCVIAPKVVSRCIDFPAVVEQGCLAISLAALVETKDRNRERLISGGAVGAALASIQAYGSNTNILTSCLKTLSSLSSCESSHSKLKASTISSLVVRILKYYSQNSFVEAMQAPQWEVIVLSLKAIKRVCAVEGLHSKLLAEGACDAIVYTMQAFVSNERIVAGVASASHALCGGEAFTATATLLVAKSALSPLGAVSRSTEFELLSSACEAMGSAGVCSALYELLNLYSANADALSMLYSLAHVIAAHPPCRARFSKTGICALLSRHLLQYQESPNVVLQICLSVGSLALPDIDYPHSNQSALGESGCCESVVAALAMYADHFSVAEAACRSIAHLAYKHNANKRLFLATKVNQSIMVSLGKYYDKVTFSVHGCLAIASLAEDDVDQCDSFGGKALGTAMSWILKKHPGNEGVVEACCQVVAAASARLNPQFYKAGMCKLVVAAMAHHISSENLSRWLCKVVSTLARYSENKAELCTHGACEAIITALYKHVGNESMLSVMLMRNTSSAGVARHGCDAMFNLAMNDTFTSSTDAGSSGSGSNTITTTELTDPKNRIIEEYQRKFVAAGACEFVAKAMVKYSEVEEVASSCAKAVFVLCCGNEQVRARLGSLGVCNSIVDSLHMFPASALEARWGCSAAAALSDNNNEANITRLAMAGICETLPMIMQAHQPIAEVAEAGCAAIANLTTRALNSAGNNSLGLAGSAASLSNGTPVTRLGDAGACEAVVTALKTHAGNVGVVASGCLALANLGLTKGNSSWFGATGACEALLHGFRLHRLNIGVCAAACEAVGNLCSEKDNRERLGAGGACELAVEALLRHLHAADVSLWASYCIGRLCEKGLSDPVPATIAMPLADGSNRSKLNHAGACEAVVQALLTHSGHVIASFNLCRTISILCHGDSCAWERETLGSHDACEAVVMALQRHIDSEGVCRNAALALRSLCHHHPKNQEKILRVGGCAAIAQSLNNCKSAGSSSSVVQALAWCIHNLATDSDEIKSLLGKAGACDRLVSALDAHGRSLEATYWICLALYQLVHEHAGNRSSVAFSPLACDNFVSIVSRYYEHEQLTQVVSFTMLEVASDRVGQHKLGKAGACRHAVSLLARGEGDRSDSYVQLYVELVGALCKRSHDNQKRVALAGGLKQLAALLEKLLVAGKANSAYFAPPATNSPTAAEGVGRSHISFSVGSANRIKKNKILSLLASSVSTASNIVKETAIGIAGGASAVNNRESDLLDKNNPLSRYTLTAETIKALVCAMERNETNRKKLMKEWGGLVDHITSFIEGGYGYAGGFEKEEDSLRFLLEKLLKTMTTVAEAASNSVAGASFGGGGGSEEFFCDDAVAGEDIGNSGKNSLTNADDDPDFDMSDVYRESGDHGLSDQDHEEFLASPNHLRR